MTAGASGALLELFEDLNAVQVGHANIEQNQVGRFVLRQAQSGIAGRGFDDLISPLLALLAQRPAHQALVVDDQDLLGRHAVLSLLRKGREGT